MSTLGNHGLQNTNTNTLVIDINNSYFPDSSYSFYAHLVPAPSVTQYTADYATITPGIWFAHVSVQFMNSPICSVGIYTNAIGSNLYGTGSASPYLYDNNQGRIYPNTGCNMVSWNAVSGFDAGSSNGCSTSCLINVPSSQPSAIVGISVFNEVSGSVFYPYFTIVQIGPPSNVISYS